MITSETNTPTHYPHSPKVKERIEKLLARLVAQAFGGFDDRIDALGGFD